MNIENLASLLNAKIINNPKIFAINSLSLSVNRLKKGDAFIAFDIEDVPLALQKGAYAIIAKDFSGFLDEGNFFDEIAFLKMDNLENSLIRFMRFTAIKKNLQIFYLNKIQSSVLNNLNFQRAFLLSDDLKNNFEIILLAKDNDLIFGDNESKLEKIFGYFNVLELKNNLNIIKQGSIFFSSFVYNEKYFSNLNLPTLFIKDFCEILEVFDKNDIKFKINDLRQMPHFDCVFVDNNFNIKLFGMSDKVIICESDLNIFRRIYNFMIKNYKDFISVSLSEIDTNTIKIKKPSDILNLKNFKYLLFFGEKSELDFLKKNEIEISILD